MKKTFSILGLVAVIAFFLPWAKGCQQVESGFQLLILDSLKGFGIDSLSSLNIGLVLLLTPLYIFLSVWLARNREHLFNKAFALLAILSMINTGIWIGLLINMIHEEWGTEQHSHSIFSAKILGLVLLGGIFLVIHLFNWARTKKFKQDWAEFCILFPCIATSSFIFCIEPRYYGFYLYFSSIVALCCYTLISATWKKNSDVSLRA